MSSITNRLSDLDIQLPEPPAAVASYVPARIAGGYLYVSGQLPFSDGKLLATGPVPSVTTIEEAVHAAKFCGINALAVAEHNSATTYGPGSPAISRRSREGPKWPELGDTS